MKINYALAVKMKCINFLVTFCRFYDLGKFN